MPERFTDQQMALIVKRAAELQEAGDARVHTLESIQQIGEQVGIDPALIAHAAATLPTKIDNQSAVWGEPSSYRLSRRIPGVVRAADHAELAATIRDHLPVTGELRTVGDGFEWHGGPADNKTLIAVTPAGDGTQLRVDVRQQGPKIGLYLAAGSLTAVAALAGTIASPLTGAALLVGVGTASYIAARAAWQSIAARSRRRVVCLADALAHRSSPSDSA